MGIFSTKVGFSRDLGFDDLCMPSMGSSVAAALGHVVSGGISSPLKFPRPRMAREECRGPDREIGHTRAQGNDQRNRESRIRLPPAQEDSVLAPEVQIFGSLSTTQRRQQVRATQKEDHSNYHAVGSRSSHHPPQEKWPVGTDAENADNGCSHQQVHRDQSSQEHG
jgi:hypothetical protein